MDDQDDEKAKSTPDDGTPLSPAGSNSPPTDGEKEPTSTPTPTPTPTPTGNGIDSYGNQQITPKQKRFLIWTFPLLIVFAICGTLIFFSSSIEFDYMKMRDMPLYGNASTIGDFSRDVYRLRKRMENNDELVRGSIRDRSIVDIKIQGQQSLEQAAVSNAKAALFAVLDPNQKNAIGTLSANYTDVDHAYARVCNQTDAGNVNAMIATFPVTSAASSSSSDSSSTTSQVTTATATPPVKDRRGRRTRGASPNATSQSKAQITPLSPQVSAQVCSPLYVECDDLTFVQKAISQVKMRCAELQLQTLKSQKAMTYDGYDTAKVIYDLLRVRYPDFEQNEVGRAEKVVDTYMAITPDARKRIDAETCCCPKPDDKSVLKALDDATRTCCCTAQVGKSSASASSSNSSSSGTSPASCPPDDNKFWDWVLGWPLVANYVILVLAFGVIGRMTKYYFDFAKPGKNPQYTPIFPMIQGGSSGLIVFMLCAAGFQFLTASAGGPDLAYPNPLTVCGLGLIAGVGADAVFEGLGKFIAKFAGNPPSGDTGQANATKPE